MTLNDLERRNSQWSFRKLTTMGTPKLSAEGAKFEADAEGAERGGVWGGVSPLQPTRGSGEPSKLPQRGPGGAPAANAFCHILGSRKHLFGQQNAF